MIKPFALAIAVTLFTATLLGSSQGFAQTCAEVFDTKAAGVSRDLQNENLEARVAEWEADVSQVMQPCEGATCLAWPRSVAFSFSSADRKFIGEAAIRLRRSVADAVPSVMDQLVDRQNDSLSQILDSMGQSIREKYFQSPIAAAEVTTGERKLRSYWEQMTKGTNLQDFHLAPVVNSANHYLARIESLREKYGSQLVDDDVMIGAGFGNLASRVILDSTGDHRTSTKALDAISLLHPLTDNALDRGYDVGESMKKITEFIAGKPRNFEAENDYEKLVLDLVSDIFEEFPRTQHPQVAQLLMGLHRAQLDSAKIQKSHQATRQQVYDIVVRKGGYTGLLMAYLARGSLTVNEAKYFFQAGSLFQLGDDLLDVKEDLHDNVRTAWTMGLKSDQDFNRTFQSFLKLQSHLETSVAQIENKALREGLLNDVQSGFKFYLISAHLNPRLQPRIAKYLRDKIPFSPKNMRSILFQTFYNLEQLHGHDEKLMAALTLYGRVFDHHFLNGQYAAWKARGQRVRPYRVSFWNPTFAAVRFETLISDKMRRSGPESLRNWILSLGTAQLIESSWMASHAHGGDFELSRSSFIVASFLGLKVASDHAQLTSSTARPVGWAWLATLVATNYAFIHSMGF